MYNLLVSGNEEEWDGEPFILEMERCVREYTDIEITQKYGDLLSEQKKDVKSFPSVFAYEINCKKDPKFGLIRDIGKRQGKAKIEYEIFSLEKFLNYSELFEMSFDLDILDLELYRTHWAIKDVNLFKELNLRGICLPRWANRYSKAVDISNHKFDVALSFPGEARNYIKEVVDELEKLIGPNAYFYDENYVAQLARPSLDIFLQDIYKKRSKLIVVFLCKKYQEKEWCGIEFRAIREIIMERKHDKVMFVKLDDGEVEGILKTDGFIDARKYSSNEIARFIQDRI